MTLDNGVTLCINMLTAAAGCSHKALSSAALRASPSGHVSSTEEGRRGERRSVSLSFAGFWPFTSCLICIMNDREGS